MNGKKIASLALSTVLALGILSGCGAKGTTGSTPAPTAKATATPAATPAPTTAAKETPKADAVTTASIVNDQAAFIKAISKDGTWIICTLKDMTIDKELVLDGEFKNGKKDANGKDVIQRKIGLYTQDANKKVTARFTLTAPKLTVNSPNARIQSGTFKGDVYVTAKNFELVDATVDGNLYFANDDAKATFKMDAASKVTGKQEVKK